MSMFAVFGIPNIKKAPPLEQVLTDPISLDPADQSPAGRLVVEGLNPGRAFWVQYSIDSESLFYQRPHGHNKQLLKLLPEAAPKLIAHYGRFHMLLHFYHDVFETESFKIKDRQQITPGVFVSRFPSFERDVVYMVHDH